MKIAKKKLVFLGIVIVILIFIIIYGWMAFGETAENGNQLEQTTVPVLEDNQKEYKTRMEAVDNLKEKKPSNAPSMYAEDFIDNEGNYDPYLPEKDKMKLMDSILASGPDLDDYGLNIIQDTSEKTIDSMLPDLSVLKAIELASIGNGHTGFFSDVPSVNKVSIIPVNTAIYAMVNGDQVVRKNERLELRLAQDVSVAGDTLQKNTILYADCNFKSNRLLLTIFPIGKLKTSLKAFDISDGQQGIYIENSFRSQATTEVLDDVIQDINISGVPQVSGLKGIFQRNNRSVKVKVLNQYQLILKPSL